MYLNEDYAEHDQDALFDLIEEHRLGVLTTAIESDSFPFLQSTHIPFVLDRKGGKKGILRGHIARANPHAKQLVQYHRSKLEQAGSSSDPHVPTDRVSTIFTHKTQAYVTPRFYLETKPSTGKVVPTWNYAAVEVRGALRIRESGEYIVKQISDLTSDMERSFNPSENTKSENDQRTQDYEGWKVSDAPERYVNLMTKAIVGIEIEIENIEGKYKMSQNKTGGDLTGVIEGFKSLNTEEAREMADLIQARSKNSR
ncbi:putative transcriptional regulator [Meira miltonrushii]|uniref:Putative transcriptional regulator n=1 Tax=Meira miltonrushii TaxID=1280837 RepID=A0A316V5X4_9BASI|nr:putative transcriptional regulator [Meira miltonrushii]PWN31603.1 putative transcriptional regulator [Meira miltonrushii]